MTNIKNDPHRQVTYDLKLVREIMNYLREVNTDKSIELLKKMLCPNPQNTLTEEELRIRCMTTKEREAVLYGASLPKDSSILKTLRTLCESTKSSN